MAIDYEQLMGLRIPDVEHRYGARDSILYALAIGLGHDPLDERALTFCYEKNLRALPTMAIILGHPGFWIRELDTGLDWTQSVHLEQGLRLHRAISPEGAIVGKTRVIGLIDKGADKGAIVISERTLLDQSDGALIATMVQTVLCRGDGGFGGPEAAAARPESMPDRAPDIVVDLPTRPEMALHYRMSSDPNPLHADPTIARSAGFDRPILHGLASFGVAGHAVLKACCGFDPEPLRGLGVRFARPVFPGDSLRTEIWCESRDTVRFQCRAIERDILVLSHGHANLAGD